MLYVVMPKVQVNGKAKAVASRLLSLTPTILGPEMKSSAKNCAL